MKVCQRFTMNADCNENGKPLEGTCVGVEAKAEGLSSWVAMGVYTGSPAY